MGQILVHVTVKLLFTRGFTIGYSNESRSRVDFIVWAKGIGSKSSPLVSKDEIINRIETMRLLQVLIGRKLYSLAHSPVDSYSKEMVTSLGKVEVLGIMCSFINTIIGYDPIGWAALPYNHV